MKIILAANATTAVDGFSLVDSVAQDFDDRVSLLDRFTGSFGGVCVAYAIIHMLFVVLFGLKFVVGSHF